MAEALAPVFSRVDALKRRLYDMITNPRDYASMLGGRVQEAAAEREAVQQQAFGNPQNPLQVTNPQALNQLTNMIMAGEMGFAPAGITAYHGSPYLFRQFDPMKVGTGEGAQAYGVGAGYTAEARPVASSYLPKTSEEIAQKINVLESELDKFKSYLRVAKKMNSPDIKVLSEKINELKTQIEQTKKSAGYLYKGEIPDEILPKFLDWDKPLSQQSDEVKTALEKTGIVNFEQNIGPSSVGEIRNLGFRNVGTLTGEELYKRLTEKNFAQKTQVTSGARKEAELDASNFLENIGVRGIRYLDQGSRGEGKGTSNFIPFRPEDYKIQEINDIPVEEWKRKGLLD